MNKRFLLGAAGVAVFVAGASFPDLAVAQKGSFLKPMTSWAVAKAQGHSGEYCTMARRFEYNTILTVAQNRESESTFALDFQRPILKKRKTLELILDPGAGQERRFEVEPISNQAFVARLGHDPGFFDALKRTGFLRVEVDRQSYNFNLSDIDEGRFRLNDCVSSLQIPLGDVQKIQISEADPHRVAVPVARAEKLDEKLPEADVRHVSPPRKPEKQKPQPDFQQRAQAQTLAYHEEVAALRRKVKEMADTNQDLSEKLRVSEARVPLPVPAPKVEGVSVDEANRLSLEVTRLKTRNGQLQEELAAVYAEQKAGEAGREEAGIAQAELLKATEAEARDLRTKTAQQEEKIKALVAGSIELEALRRNYASLEREKLALENRLSEKQASHAGQQGLVSQLQEQVTDLQALNGNLGRELEALKQIRADRDAALKAVEVLQLENEQLRTAQNENAREVAELRSALAQREEAVAAALSRRAEDDSDRHSQEQLARKDLEIAALKEKLDQISLLRVSQDIALFDEEKQRENQPDALEPVRPVLHEGEGEDVSQRASSAPVENKKPSEFPSDTSAGPLSQNTEGMSPAQRQELSMKEGLQEKVASIEPFAGDSDEVLEVRRSADPFDGVSVQEPSLDDRGRGQEEGGRKPLPEPVALRSSGQEKIAAAIPGDALYHADISVPLLVAASSPSAPVHLIEKASTAENLVYQWSDHNVYGSAEQKSLGRSSRFDDLVLDYLERTENRCPGAFAVVPDGSVEQAGMRVDRYDVACVNDNVSSSASLLFISKGDTFTAFAHETPTARLMEAMESRERLVGVMMSSDSVGMGGGV